MDNALKGFLLAAGVIITCLIIGIGFLVAREASATASSSSALLSDFQNELSESNITRYDGLEVAGSDVVNFIKKQLEGQSKEVKNFYIKVVQVGKSRSYDQKSDLAGLRKYGHVDYIVPSSRFTGKVERDLNGVIVGITFE